MTKVRAKGEKVRKFILDKVEKHPTDIAKVAAEQFGTTRQAVGKHLTHLVQEGALVESGKTRAKSYALCPMQNWSKRFHRNEALAEDIVWRDDIAPVLGPLPENVRRIWEHGFTEIFNNAIDHSEAADITVSITKTARDTQIIIFDDGVGIFEKIQKALDLLDVRQAVLELAKGKLTTDPARHTGEGIFFSSRMFDSFQIMASHTYFSHTYGDEEDWVLEDKSTAPGTAVFMKLHNHTARTTQQVFSAFESEDYAFTKTVVPVHLAQYGDDKLVSRSQARRLLQRVDRFRTVILDFAEVASIGQAFADEIFRVFVLSHPDIEIMAIRANEEVQRLIGRARRTGPVETADTLAALADLREPKTE